MNNTTEMMSLINKRLVELEIEYQRGSVDVMSYAHKTDELRYLRSLITQ